MMAEAKKGKRRAPKSRLPEPLPPGFVVNDMALKKQWVVGSEIGSGGFGRVYFTSDGESKDCDYILKVEFHQNGPLFSEIHAYMCFGRPSQIKEWIREKKLTHLGISPNYGFGSFEYNGSKYRFLVLQRFGTDLSVLLKRCGDTFTVKSAYTIAISVLNSLEYIHSYGYVHLDIKAANLLLGRKLGTESFVYLLDMGLSTKYINNGEHRKEIPDPKKSHNGTMEYMSRDSHKGTPCTRRADLETLAYNLVHWLCGHLPWENTADCVKVQELKELFMKDIKKSLLSLFPEGDIPTYLIDFLKYVKSLKYAETPNYDACRKAFEKALVSEGEKFTGALNFGEKKKKNKEVVPLASISCKENIKCKDPGDIKKAGSKRRREKPSISLDPSITPTPAMLAVLNKKS